MNAKRSLRVLVAFECCQPSEDVLRQLPRLLDSDRLEVTGLYVEDDDLLRAASLPGLREISLSGQESSLDAGRITREIASEAAAAKLAFERLGEQLGSEFRRMHHQFRVARGRTAEELDRAAGESDFVMVIRALRASGLRPRVGRAFARLVQQPKHILFVNEPWSSGSSVVVLHGSASALDYATRVAATNGLRLVVAFPPGASSPPVPHGAVAKYLADWHEDAIAAFCLSEDARLLVIPAQEELDWNELLLSLMDRLPCSVLKLA